MKPGCTVVNRSSGLPGIVLAALAPHEDAVPHLNQIWADRPDIHHALVLALRGAGTLHRSVPTLLVVTESSHAGHPFYGRPWLWFSPESFWTPPTEREPRRYVWRDTGSGWQIWDNVRGCWRTEARPGGGVDMSAWLREEIERRLEVDPPNEP